MKLRKQIGSFLTICTIVMSVYQQPLAAKEDSNNGARPKSDQGAILSKLNQASQAVKTVKKNTSSVEKHMDNMLKKPRQPSGSAKAHKPSCAKCDKVFTIDKLPYVIKKSGKYVVKEDLKFDATKYPGNPVAITVASEGDFTGGVVINFKQHSLDMQGEAGTAILLSGVEDVTIVNGFIRNSGKPKPVAPNQFAIPPASLGELNLQGRFQDSVIGEQQVNLDFKAAHNPPFPNPTTQSGFVVVTALNPIDGVGIALTNGCEGVTIRNMTMDHMFIGIAGISTASDGSDGSDDVFITKCRGIECGGFFGPAEEPPVPPPAPGGSSGPQPMRGAFISFGAQTFLGPFSAAPFYEMPEVFERISIQDCVGFSNAALAGIYLNYTSNALIENCYMSLGADNVTPNTIDLVASYLGYFNSHLNIRDSVGTGGMDSFRLSYLYSTVIDNCLGIYHFNAAFSTYWGQNVTLRDCIGSEALNISAQNALVTNYGIEFIGVTYSTLVDSIVSNYRAVSCSNVDGIGVNVVGSNCLIKNNIIFQNHVGMYLAFSDHCILDGNEIFSNGNDLPKGGLFFNQTGSVGLLYGYGFEPRSLPINGDPNRGNQFYRNYFHNNGQNGATNVFSLPFGSNGISTIYAPNFITPEIPHLITGAFNGLNPIAPYANIQSQPSITMIQFPVVLPFNPVLHEPSVACNGTLNLQVYVQGGSASVFPTKFTLYQANGNIQTINSSNLYPQFVTFTVPNVSCADQGYYFVRVDFTNGSYYYSNYQYYFVTGAPCNCSTSCLCPGTFSLDTDTPACKPRPLITSNVVPNSGPAAGGTTVNISGNNFFNVSQVLFGGVPATSFSSLSTNQLYIQAVAPPHAAGTVDITIITPAGTSYIVPADQYTYTP